MRNQFTRRRLLEYTCLTGFHALRWKPSAESLWVEAVIKFTSSKHCIFWLNLNTYSDLT